MAISVCSLGSGSKGNSVLVVSGEHKILIDCGLNIRDLSARLLSKGVTPAELEAVIITHEHTDHIRSIKALADKFNVPIFLHQNTCEAIGTGMPDDAYLFKTLNGFRLDGFEVHPFRTSHDAAYPLGYSISDDDSRFVYATDLGYVGKDILAVAKGADIVMIESNYDPTMLANGSYPYFLKQRIASTCGHLSNGDCACAVEEIADSGTKKFVLGHISAENNKHQLVFDTTCDRLAACGAVINRDFELVVATQDLPSATLESR